MPSKRSLRTPAQRRREQERQFKPLAIELGWIAYEWNRLHEALGELFADAMGADTYTALSAWHAVALAAAGVPVEQLQARGHFHSSFTMVDVVITGVSGREQMAEALRRFAGLPSERKQGDKGVRPSRTASQHEIATAAE